MAVNITLSHSSLSKALTFTSFRVLASDELVLTGNTNSLNTSLLDIQAEVLPIEERIEVTFNATINLDDIEGNITDRVVVNYVTILQEGIGVEVHNHLKEMCPTFKCIQASKCV